MFDCIISNPNQVTSPRAQTRELVRFAAPVTERAEAVSCRAVADSDSMTPRDTAEPPVTGELGLWHPYCSAMCVRAQ